MVLTVGEQTYRLEFRYVTKLGKRAQLHKGPIKAVTTAVLIVGEPRFKTSPLIAIDNALCAEADNFSRREGRNRSFKKLLEHCGALRDVRVRLWAEFNYVFNGITTPVAESGQLLFPPARTPSKISSGKPTRAGAATP